MTAGPLVLAICLNVEAKYELACRVALEQAAVQTGVEANLEDTRKKWEKRAAKYANFSVTSQLIGGAAVYIIRFANGQKATFSVPNPTSLGAISTTVSKEFLGVVWRIDF